MAGPSHFVNASTMSSFYRQNWRLFEYCILHHFWHACFESVSTHQEVIRPSVVQLRE